MITPKELKARYPYQFESQNIGLSFYKGWMPLFAKLCADIDTELGANKRNFHWSQLKEKFGAARFYSQMDSSYERNEYDNEIDERNSRLADPNEVTLRQRIHKLRMDAESLTQSKCCVCGEPGEVDESQGWILVVCDEHARQRKLGTMETPWFEADN